MPNNDDLYVETVDVGMQTMPFCSSVQVEPVSLYSVLPVPKPATELPSESTVARMVKEMMYELSLGMTPIIPISQPISVSPSSDLTHQLPAPATTVAPSHDSSILVSMAKNWSILRTDGTITSLPALSRLQPPFKAPVALGAGVWGAAAGAGVWGVKNGRASEVLAGFAGDVTVVTGSSEVIMGISNLNECKWVWEDGKAGQMDVQGAEVVAAATVNSNILLGHADGTLSMYLVHKHHAPAPVPLKLQRIPQLIQAIVSRKETFEVYFSDSVLRITMDGARPVLRASPAAPKIVRPDGCTEDPLCWLRLSESTNGELSVVSVPFASATCAGICDGWLAWADGATVRTSRTQTSLFK